MTSITELLDQIRPELQPLDNHYLFDGDLIIKERYIVLLLAMLLDEGVLTEPQVRLLNMVLSSIGQVQELAFYLQQSQQINKDEIRKTIEIFYKDKSISYAFIFDMLVLTRVSGIPTRQVLFKINSFINIIDFKDVKLLIEYCMTLFGTDINTYCRNIIKHVNANDFHLKEIEKTGGYIDLTSDGMFTKNTSNTANHIPWGLMPFSPKTMCEIKDLFDIERKAISSNGYLLMDDDPFKDKVFPEEKKIVMRAKSVGVYKLISIPKGIIVKTYKNNWSTTSWGKEKSELVAEIIPITKEINAWFPLYKGL